jgi:hypothetical protein
MGWLLLCGWGKCVGKLLRMGLLLLLLRLLISSHHLRHAHLCLVLIGIKVILGWVYWSGFVPVWLLVALVLGVCVDLWLE